MSTTVAAVRGSTPSLNHHLTPATAPVHEFRCLFTRDSHKKAKKWHDGSVRFHTFNRRVMVYDDGKNYVGDLHYRQDEDFDEGVELYLDRGVLVDVGERLGETQTDLAPILDRKKDEASPQALRTVRRVAAGSQKELKSLSQILGTQSRTGRARRLPSPYQQRQPLIQVQPSETLMPPPPKRQKLDSSGKENRPSHPQTKNSAQTVRQRAEILPPAPRPGSLKDPAVNFQEVVDLSSDEEVRNTVRKIMPKLSKKKMQIQAQGQTLQKTLAQEIVSVTIGKGPTIQTPLGVKKTDLLRKPTKSTKETERPRGRTDDLSTSNTRSQPSTSSRVGMTKLKFRTQKPRRKLMYRALLPSSMVESASASKDHPHTDENGSPVVLQDSSEALLSPSFVAEREGPQSPTRAGSLRSVVEEDIQLASSPLFIPEENLVKSPSHIPRRSQDSPVAQIFGRSSTPQSQVTCQRQPNQPRTRMSSPLEEDLETSRMQNLFPSKQMQMLPPSIPGPGGLHTSVSPSSRQRPFRRVRSENDVGEDEIMELDGFSAPPPSFLANSKASPVRAFRSFSRSPAKLRRTASDSGIIDQDTETLTSYSIEPIEEANGETGPWTSAEAYLLFEWWPSGKMKPDHGAPTLKTGHTELHRATITTARDMLRDEINVL